jgi:hypothetical protein
MSTRERWIVYPLLFMTLGIALRDKIVPPEHRGNVGEELQAGVVTAKQVRCAQLQTAEVLVGSPGDHPVVIVGTDANTHAGLIETFTAGGMLQVRLHSNNIGGMVTAFERAGKLALILCDTGQNFGLFAEVPDLGQHVPLTLPWRFETKPAPSQPPKKPAEVQPPKTPPKPTKK